MSEHKKEKQLQEEKEKQQQSEAEKIFNEYKMKKNVIDFNANTPPSVDFMSVLTSKETLQYDIERLMNIEGMEKQNAKQQKTSKKKDVPIYMQIKVAANKRYGGRSINTQRYIELAQKYLMGQKVPGIEVKLNFDLI